MAEQIVKCQNAEDKADELLNRGYSDEGDMFIKSINDNSSICIDKETGVVADVTNDGVSCEGLGEILDLASAGLIETSQETEEVVEDAKESAEAAEGETAIN